MLRFDDAYLSSKKVVRLPLGYALALRKFRSSSGASQCDLSPAAAERVPPPPRLAAPVAGGTGRAQPALGRSAPSRVSTGRAVRASPFSSHPRRAVSRPERTDCRVLGEGRRGGEALRAPAP